MTRRMRVGSVVELLPSFKKGRRWYSDEFLKKAVPGDVGILYYVSGSLHYVCFLRDVWGFEDGMDGDLFPSGHGQNCRRRDLRVVLDPL